jgi:hypothetical protein
MKNYIETTLTDHAFAAYLHNINPKWTWQHMEEYTKYFDNKICIAIAKFKNSPPISRRIWILKNEK